MFVGKLSLDWPSRHSQSKQSLTATIIRALDRHTDQGVLSCHENSELFVIFFQNVLKEMQLTRKLVLY